VSSHPFAERPSGRFFTPVAADCDRRPDRYGADLLLRDGSLPTLFTRLHFMARRIGPRSYNRVLWTLLTSTQAARLKAVVLTR